MDRALKASFLFCTNPYFFYSFILRNGKLPLQNDSNNFMFFVSVPAATSNSEKPERGFRRSRGGGGGSRGFYRGARNGGRDEKGEVSSSFGYYIESGILGDKNLAFRFSKCKIGYFRFLLHFY